MTSSLRASLARRLEEGAPGSRLAGLAAVAWGALARAERPLRIPAGVRLIGVGGAVLGGAGKTPVAIAVARALASRGEPVALIGHAYRAHPGRPRVVHAGDPVAVVGDDALAAARLLDGTSAAVIVAPRRQDAVDHAAALGHRVLVADGLLQAAPRRLAAALLVLDALAPWGAGACPPAGDLRALPAALLSAATTSSPSSPRARLPLPPFLPRPSCSRAASPASSPRPASLPSPRSRAVGSA